ncbi:hypothetical protein DFH09DRAFT_1086257 [Mycena vulgaris]|nr:hypothetical protein DFH09DRAFT_1086257 [Mycena vulgaris]
MKGEGIENKAEVKNKEVWLCLVDAIRSRERASCALLSTTYVPPLRIYTGARPVFATPAVACIVLCYDARHFYSYHHHLNGLSCQAPQQLPSVLWQNRDSVLKYSGTSGRKPLGQQQTMPATPLRAPAENRNTPSSSLFPLALSQEPPFEEDNDASDPDSEAYHRFTQSLVDVPPRREITEQNELDVQRRADFNVNGMTAGVTALCEELETLLLSWERVKALNIYHEHHDSREFAIMPMKATEAALGVFLLVAHEMS